MPVKLVPAKISDRATIDKLYQNYYYDIMIAIGHLDKSVERRQVDTNSLDKYWQQKNCFPYLISTDNEAVGFSLVRQYPLEPMWMDFEQFYIDKKHQRRGFGKGAVSLSIQQHPGKWIVRVIPENLPGLVFWTKTIANLTNDKFTCATEEYDNKPMHFFRFKIE